MSCSAIVRLPRAKVIVYAVNPFSSTHIRPLVCLKTRSVFQSLLIKRQDRIAFWSMEVQHSPRDGEAFISKTQKTTEGQDRVDHHAGARVDDQILNFSQIFLSLIQHFGTNDRRLYRYRVI